MKTFTPWLLSLAAMLLSGCGLLSPITHESAEWREEFGAFRTNITDSVNTLSLSIPGERERRLIEAAHSTDPKVREKAQEIIQSLYGFDIKEAGNFECSIWFDYPSNTLVKAQMFAAGSPSLKAVQNHLNNYELNPTDVRSTLQPPPSAEQVKDAVNKKIDTAIDLLTGDYEIKQIMQNGNNVTLGSVWPKNALTPELTVNATSFSYSLAHAKSDLRNKLDTALRNRQKARNELSQAILAAYKSSSTTTLGRAGKVIPWNVLEQKPYLIILVRKSDLETYTNQFKVQALVHKKGDTHQAYKQLEPFQLQYADFTQHQTVTNSTWGEFQWAVANVEQSDTLSPEMLQKIEDLEKTLKQIQAGQTGSTAAPGS